MNFKKWWRSLAYWRKGIFIGIVIGLLKVPFFAIFGIHFPEFIIKFFEVPDKQICNFLGISDGEPCGFFFLYYGVLYNPIFYAIIGGLMGFLYNKVRKK
ncbi:MAG TPA: hypothetical protein VJI97_04900 [Candidatus Nanoarchaeia archaeon]|nr:hypothetical protein [Candidatus Nanoarchaeia archaeon]